MAWQDAVTLATLALVILGVWLGRRKGRSRVGAAIAAARAEGHADARAEIAAQLTQTVQVVNGAPLPGESDRETDVLARALRLIAVESRRSFGTADDHRAASDDIAALVSGVGERPRSVHYDNELSRLGFVGPGDREPARNGVDRSEA